MNKLKAKFGKKQDISPLTSATKDFIKGAGDDGLQFLPSILESCSSASASSLASQIEVLDLINKYYGQNQALTRQLRCIDLLRYLSDQHDNDLFNLLSQGHPLLKSIDNTLKTVRPQSPLQKHTRILLDHLVRQPNVPDTVIELHAKHVNGFNKPHKPTIILSDQEVVADDIAAGTAESELLVALLTEGKADETLVKEVLTRINNTRERLVRDIDTSTNEAQTVNLLETVERIDRVLLIRKEMAAQNSIGSTDLSQDFASAYVAPGRASLEDDASLRSRKTSSSRAGKSKASYNQEDDNDDAHYESLQIENGQHIWTESGDNAGEGSSGNTSRHEDGAHSTNLGIRQTTPSPQKDPSPLNGSPLSSNNPFAPKVKPRDRSFSPSNPYASMTESTSPSPGNPFTSYDN